MRPNFQIESKKSEGAWHIDPVGDFDGASALELIDLLSNQYNGEGRVLIDTGRLQNLCPFGCRMFQCQFHQCRIPAGRVSFRGEKGYALAPEGSRVVVEPEKHKCRCNGNCVNCPCAGKKNRNETTIRDS